MITYFFFNDTATTEIYTLSLHDALPIFAGPAPRGEEEVDALLERVGDPRQRAVHRAEWSDVRSGDEDAELLLRLACGGGEDRLSRLDVPCRRGRPVTGLERQVRPAELEQHLEVRSLPADEQQVGGRDQREAAHPVEPSGLGDWADD